MKKKIMLIVPMLHQGGFERVCVATARLLEPYYDVYIVIFSSANIAYDIKGLNVIDLRMGTVKSRIGKIKNVFMRSRRVTRLKRDLKIDVAYSFGTTANIVNALSRGAQKTITACHSFEEIKDVKYMHLISHGSDIILCCSKKMTDLVKNKYHFSKVETLWNPCDIEEIYESSTKNADSDIAFWGQDDKVIISLGREDDVKGYWHLLKAFRRVHEQDCSTKLAIVGSGDFYEYENMASQLGIADKVFFTGLKKNPFPYLKASSIYVLSSLSEGLPNVLVEALALAVPIVSVNCLSGPAEILHEDWKTAEKQNGIYFADYGILTSPLTFGKNMEVVWDTANKVCLEESEETLAQAILQMLNDKVKTKDYKDRSLQRAKDFSKEKYLEALNFYINS